MNLTQGSLRQAAVRGALWLGAGSAATTIAHMLQLVVLARLLDARDFGLMGMALVIVGFSRAFADGGFSNAVIARSATTAQLSSLYWCNLIAGAIVFGVVWAATPLATAFFGEAQLNSILPLTAISFIILPIGQQMRVLLQRELAFGKLSMIESAAAGAGAIASIAAAVCDWGVFALVWGHLTRSAVESSLLLGAGWKQWRPQLRLRLADVRPFVDFGLYQMGERCVNQLAANMDYIIIGRMIGAEALGVYRVAYQLVVQPLVKINPLVTRVAFPVLALRRGDHTALRAGYAGMLRMLSLAVLPAMAGLAITAPQLVPAALGSQWEAATPLVQVLCVLGAMKTLNNPIGPLLLAKDRADLGFRWNVATLVVNTIVLTAAASWGVMAVAGAYAVLSVVYFAVLGAVALPRLIGLSVGRQWAALSGAFAATSVMAASVWLFTQAARDAFTHASSLLAQQIAIGVVVYVLALALIHGRELLAMWRAVRPARHRALHAAPHTQGEAA